MDTIQDSASAHPPDPLSAIADRIEEELGKLRRKRPALETRIDRASHILVTHLSCPRSHVIRVRVGSNGHATFLVNGSGGAVYVVDAASWQCSCPDHHRRGGICKHGIACYVLHRSAQPAARRRTCCACDASFSRGELIEVQTEHQNEQHFPGDLLCAGCADRAGVPR